jgi:hypothetical protein
VVEDGLQVFHTLRPRQPEPPQRLGRVLLQQARLAHRVHHPELALRLGLPLFRGQTDDTQRDKTNAELRVENPETNHSQKELPHLYLRGSKSALSFPKLPGGRCNKRLD